VAVLSKYAKDHGYSLIIDVSSQQTPVLFAANEIEVTGDIIKLYDQNSPGAVTTAPSTSSAPKPPAVAPAVKKNSVPAPAPK
jgi:outer membrane protein